MGMAICDDTKRKQVTCQCGSLHANAAQRYDPTRTTSLRQKFEGEAARRFRWLKGRINEAVVAQDGFGLKTNRGEFDFPRSADKVSAFMQWLQSQANAGILEIRQGEPLARAADRAWSSVYVRSAYQRGMAQSSAKLRGEGVDVAPEWVTDAFTRPFHVDRVGLAYTRTFDDLKGITDAMSSQIGRELASGLAEGKGPMAIARGMNNRVDKIGITRARMLARTETIRAHAEASLNTYEEAGVLGVGVQAEWRTAKDDAVCPECDAAARSGPYTLAEARGMIPLHPNCRCAWIPQVQNPKEVRLR